MASPLTHGFGAAAGTTARSPRRRVVIAGLIELIGGSHPVAIDNLSCTGARMRCSASLRIGAEAVLSAPGLDRFCRVVWGEGGSYGVEFDEPLDQNIVLKLHGVTRETVQRAELDSAREWYFTAGPSRS